MKTLTWRIVAIVITMVVLRYKMPMTEVLILTAIIQGVKTALFYLHERIWNVSSFGRR
jgi:uncharacterized membrane protein